MCVKIITIQGRIARRKFSASHTLRTFQQLFTIARQVASPIRFVACSRVSRANPFVLLAIPRKWGRLKNQIYFYKELLQ